MNVCWTKRTPETHFRIVLCFESVFPHVQNKAVKTKLARKKDSPPRGKFTNRFKIVSAGLRAKGNDLGEPLGGRT